MSHLGGNAWSPKADDPKVDGLEHFRKSFASNLNEDNGTFRFNDTLWNVNSRPMGTPYASTSFAYVHKNALFVTVDAFHRIANLTYGEGYFDRQNGSGGEGIISCTVTGDHLAWFEEILSSANTDDSIDHIFVQAHVPILHPVRKNDCSGQYLDRAEDSEFWKAMQRHSVDVYFAGEVHATTVSVDPQSNLIQIVSRGNRLSNFLTVDIEGTDFEITSYNEVGPLWRWNGEYEEYGRLIVKKTGAGTSIDGHGSLEVLDSSVSPIIKFNFENPSMYPFHKRQVIGIKHDQYKESMEGTSITTTVSVMLQV